MSFEVLLHTAWGGCTQHRLEKSNRGSQCLGEERESCRGWRRVQTGTLPLAGTIRWKACPLVSLSRQLLISQMSPWHVPGGPVVRNLPASAENMGLIPGPRRFHTPWGN